MATKSVRAPNNHFLIAAGVVLLLVAALGLRSATVSNAYSTPVVFPAVAHGARDAILGVALLFVALRKSRFADATAVIVATLLMFAIAFAVITDVAFGLPFHPGWRTAFYLVIAVALVGPLLSPSDWTANRAVLLWTGLTLGVITLLLSSLAMLARL